LDALARGDADAALRERLAALADSLPDGPAMLELACRLAGDRIGDLTERAPAALVAATWDRLAAALPDRVAARRPAAIWPGGRAWSGLAAAAVIALVFLSGYLVGERRQMQARLDAVLAHDTRDAPSGDRWPGVTPGLAGERTWTVGELRLLLERLPSQAVIADADELARLLVAGPPLRRNPARRLLAEYTASDGLTAGEALRLLTELSPDRDAALDIRRLGLGAPREILSY
ncbi:hypothetical protein KKG45_04105, partial [bacterium]|nr:hypothetical protein [bacterium]